MVVVLHLPEQKVIFKGVSWETYERLLAEHIVYAVRAWARDQRTVSD